MSVRPLNVRPLNVRIASELGDTGLRRRLSTKGGYFEMHDHGYIRKPHTLREGRP